MRRARAACIALLTLEITACGPLVEPGSLKRDPTPLIGSFASYQTIGDTKRIVGGGGGWVVVEDSPYAGRGACPRFDLFSVSIPKWRHVEHDGELHLKFVNGMLYSTSFYANSPETYVAALKESGVPFHRTDSIGASFSRQWPRTRIWQWRAYDGRQYVGWEDDAIRDEIDAWIRACS